MIILKFETSDFNGFSIVLGGVLYWILSGRVVTGSNWVTVSTTNGTRYRHCVATE